MDAATLLNCCILDEDLAIVYNLTSLSRLRPMTRAPIYLLHSTGTSSPIVQHPCLGTAVVWVPRSFEEAGGNNDLYFLVSEKSEVGMFPNPYRMTSESRVVYAMVSRLIFGEICRQVDYPALHNQRALARFASAVYSDGDE